MHTDVPAVSVSNLIHIDACSAKVFKCGSLFNLSTPKCQNICPHPRKGGDWYQIFSISPPSDA